MSDLHAMPFTNITHSACYTVEMGVSAEDLTRIITLDNNHTAYKQICLQGIGCVCVKNYPPEIMQPSSSKRATIAVSAENQNGATIVQATFFFCHYYIVWESNNAGEARGQSWNESLKSRWISGGSFGYTSGTKRKHFAALSSPRPCWRWLQLQPSCGPPQCYDSAGHTHDAVLFLVLQVVGVTTTWGNYKAVPTGPFYRLIRVLDLVKRLQRSLYQLVSITKAAVKDSQCCAIPFCEARRASHCHSPQTTYSSKSTCCAISAQNSAMHVVVYAGRLTSQRSIVEIINW